jgi:hypothetical protein
LLFDRCLNLFDRVTVEAKAVVFDVTVIFGIRVPPEIVYVRAEGEGASSGVDTQHILYYKRLVIPKK